MKRIFRTILRWIRYRTTHRYHIVHTRLSPNYYDKDTIMIYANFSLLVDFVEKECAGLQAIIDGKKKGTPEDGVKYLDSSAKYDKKYKTIKELYFWWTITRPARYVPYDKYDPTIDSKENDELIKEISDLEQFFEKQDTKNLIKLMKVRPYLWT